MSTIGGPETGRMCIPNIGSREQRKRLVASVIQLAIGLAVLATFMATGADHLWRLALMPVFWGAALGFFQSRDQT